MRNTIARIWQVASNRTDRLDLCYQSHPTIDMLIKTVPHSALKGRTGPDASPDIVGTMTRLHLLILDSKC